MPTRTSDSQNELYGSLTQSVGGISKKVITSKSLAQFSKRIHTATCGSDSSLGRSARKRRHPNIAAVVPGSIQPNDFYGPQRSDEQIRRRPAHSIMAGDVDSHPQAECKAALLIRGPETRKSLGMQGRPCREISGSLQESGIRVSVFWLVPQSLR